MIRTYYGVLYVLIYGVFPVKRRRGTRHRPALTAQPSARQRTNGDQGCVGVVEGYHGSYREAETGEYSRGGLCLLFVLRFQG